VVPVKHARGAPLARRGDDDEPEREPAAPSDGVPGDGAAQALRVFCDCPAILICRVGFFVRIVIYNLKY